VLLSGVLIARDEEEHLGACLRSVRGVVDEIIVVDTGSVDRTVDIARAHGAKVIEHRWADDFAAARNVGLDGARGEWILYIDADERLAVDGDLIGALRNPNAVAGLVRFRASSMLTPYLEYRLFRNRSDVRFRGAMHETMLPDLERIMTTEGLTAVPVPASIEHLGYEGDQSSKHRRNLPMLERAVCDDPDRPYLWFHLGATRLALGDDRGAEAAWWQAVRIARQEGAVRSPAVLAYVELSLLRLRTGRSAAELLADLAEHRPGDPLTSWVLAHQAMFEGRWPDAVPLLEGLLATDPDELPVRELAYNRAIFDGLAAHALGICWFQLGAPGPAAQMFQRAESADPDNLEYRVKRQLAEARLVTR